MGYDGVFRVSFPIREYEEKGGLCVGIGLFLLDRDQPMYRAPWIDAIRATALGGLVLGSVFCGVIFCVILGSFAGNHRGWLVGMEPEIKCRFFVILLCIS